ncbi:ABC transporter permease [Lachnoclostridium pacaense]|uniref:ABC transporter permease n=1 Tax=Enterocloster hominis (ex Hitch et al. 2024) TaxID=1917870 RepID=UPI001D10AB39|nr:ABC transporter permease [Lachnoclostridium pacaense]MCC2876125.1 ABC transporter permease [Lachnoclostridium pacaense]
MIVKAIICERMKCRGTLIWPAFLLIPVIPILLGAGNYLSNLEILKSGWYSYWTQVTLFYATFFFAPLIGAYCAFLWRYENFNSCRNTLFARPIPYRTIYLSKFLLVCAISAMTQIWFALLFIASGKLIGLPGLPPAALCFWMIRGLAGAFVIAALQFLAATEIRNFTTPIAIGLVGGVTGMIAANTKAGILWPYSQMLLGMNSNKSEDVLGQNAAIFFVICVVYLLGVSLIGIKRIKRNN